MALGLLALVLAGEFHWQAPQECPDEASVREQTEAVTGEPVAWSRIDVDASIVAAEDELELTLEIRTGDDDITRKVIRDPDCTVLASTAAVVIAVAAEPITVAQRFASELEEPEPPEVAEEPQPVEPEPEPEPEAPPPVVRPPAEPKPRRDPLRGAVGADVLAGTGLLPTFDVGFGGSAALVASRWQLELRAAGLLPRRVRYSGSDIGATVNAGVMRLVAGPRWRLDRTELALLAGASAAVLVSHGFGLPRTESPVDAWLGVGASPVVGLRIGPNWLVRVGLDFDVALRRPAIRADGAERLYRAPPAAAHLTLGFQWRFPRTT